MATEETYPWIATTIILALVSSFLSGTCLLITIIVITWSLIRRCSEKSYEEVEVEGKILKKKRSRYALPHDKEIGEEIKERERKKMLSLEPPEVNPNYPSLSSMTNSAFGENNYSENFEKHCSLEILNSSGDWEIENKENYGLKTEVVKKDFGDDENQSQVIKIDEGKNFIRRSTISEGTKVKNFWSCMFFKYKLPTNVQLSFDLRISNFSRTGLRIQLCKGIALEHDHVMYDTEQFRYLQRNLKDGTIVVNGFSRVKDDNKWRNIAIEVTPDSVSLLEDNIKIFTKHNDGVKGIDDVIFHLQTLKPQTNVVVDIKNIKIRKIVESEISKSSSIITIEANSSDNLNVQDINEDTKEEEVPEIEIENKEQEIEIETKEQSKEDDIIVDEPKEDKEIIVDEPKEEEEIILDEPKNQDTKDEQTKDTEIEQELVEETLQDSIRGNSTFPEVKEIKETPKEE